MIYNSGTGNEKNWIVMEETFQAEYLGKCEAIMCLGNGYMGVRSATEESYIGEIRNTFVAGTFNKANENEVTELPNIADVLAMKIKINDEVLSLLQGQVEDYSRTLNLKNGLLTRSFKWTSQKGVEVSFKFERFVSMDDRHLIGQKIIITPITEGVTVTIASGINGQLSNSGAQHFLEGNKRLYDNKYMQNTFTTNESGIHFSINAAHTIKINNEVVEPKQAIAMYRRKIDLTYTISVEKEATLEIVKLSNVYTSRDNDVNAEEMETLKAFSLEAIKQRMEDGFDKLFEASASAWQEKVWDKQDVKVTSNNDYDQLAIRFAIYHMFVMTPAHDNRMNIGAKGLSGEGYKGHTFWDTEVFLLPFFTYSDPKVARSLLEYRYFCLHGARKKAEENHCIGAMYPWETAWITDGEVTPLMGEANVVTGKQEKIWTGLIELHITSDVAFGVWQYYKVTGDQDFMDKYGYEMILDTARFWASRLEWKEASNRYEITQIIGPDEYKEHIDNNAFTNYMACWNMKLAMQYYNELKENNKDLFDKLNTTLELEEAYKVWEDRTEKIFLPALTEEGILPQDDTYLTLPSIDLTKYKEADKVGMIHKDYSMKQIGGIQVSKQADVLVLFYLLENLFDQETKKKNFKYYEPRCLHDSSLSLSTHSILASDLEEEELAYSLFRQATEIDLGPVMTTSDAGIHAASLGGIWQCIVNGFAGVRMVDGKLRIMPHLPKAWTELETSIYWSSQQLQLHVTHDTLTVINKGDKTISFTHENNEYTVEDKIVINY